MSAIWNIGGSYFHHLISRRIVILCFNPMLHFTFHPGNLSTSASVPILKFLCTNAQNKVNGDQILRQ